MTDKLRDKTFDMVEAGYDRLAELYIKEREKFDNWNEIRKFCSLLSPGAKVLDAGCGTGIPISEHLVQSGYDVVGVDLSSRMVSVAQKNVPKGRFRHQNMTEMEFASGSFDGLISCYAIFHIPREKHAALFRSFYDILKSPGVMLVSVGSCQWEEVDKYLGVDMFWSHHAPDVSESLIIDAGFEIEFGRDIESGGETHRWILTRKTD
jgi:ubiquinone/menaquinone biosynthesis C-methylase UbiE